MRKLLFVHGTKFKKDDEGNFYTTGSYNSKVWNRYQILGKSITVIARLEENTYTRQFASDNFNSFPQQFGFLPVPDLTKNLRYYFRSRKQANELIKNQVSKSDIVVARLPSTFGYMAIGWAKRLSKPFIVEVVGCPWDALWNHSLRGKILALPNYLLMKYYVKNSSYVMYVTEKFLQNRYPSRGLSIGCSDVVIADIDNEILKRRLEKIDNSFAKKKLCLGTVAALDVGFKGQQYVIYALKKLKESGLVFEYRLIGGGDPKFLSDLSKKLGVEDCLKIYGSIPHDMVLNELDSIDIYIQPSKQEGLPRALIEAMSRGCLAIGSNAGGIPELLDARYIIRKGDYMSIVKLLRGISKSMLIEQAEINFRKSQNYRLELVENKRNNFYNQFKTLLQSR